MTIALTPSQQRNYSWLRAGQTGAFTLYLAMVILSMTSTVSPAIKPAVSAILVLLVAGRIGYVYSTARRKLNPRWLVPSFGGGISIEEKRVIDSCKRDAHWQLARTAAILLFAFFTTSGPVVGTHVMIAAAAAALFAAAGSLGDQAFTVPAGNLSSVSRSAGH